MISVDYQIREQIKDHLLIQIRYKVNEQVCDFIRTQLRWEVDDIVWDQVTWEIFYQLHFGKKAKFAGGIWFEGTLNF